MGRPKWKRRDFWEIPLKYLTQEDIDKHEEYVQRKLRRWRFYEEHIQTPLYVLGYLLIVGGISALTAWLTVKYSL